MLFCCLHWIGIDCLGTIVGPVYVIVFDMLMVATACLAGYVWAKMMKGVEMRLMPYSVADALQC